MLFASSSMHSTRPYLCTEIVFICDIWSLEVTSYNTCKLPPSPSTIPSILRHRGHWGCVPGSSFSHWVPLPSPLGETGRWKNQWCSGEPGSLALCNQVQGRIQNLYKLCSRDCPMFAPWCWGELDDPCVMLYQISNTEVVKDLEFYADQHKPF